VRQVTNKQARSLLLPAAVITAGFFAAGGLFGARGMAVVAVVSFLWLAWRFDNHTGSIFLLAVLLLIVLGVILLLMAMLAIFSGSAR
jgi:hypothetical protein